MQALLTVLDESEATVIMTGSNADTGASSIRHALAHFAAKRPDRVALAESLGARRYLSLMSYVDAVVGNSSSGLLEAPAMGVPTVDIGDRQKGRLRAPSVIHCGEDIDSIRAALALALSSEQRALAAQRETPYGAPGAAHHIADVLASVQLENIDKPFVNHPTSSTANVDRP